MGNAADDFLRSHPELLDADPASPAWTRLVTALARPLVAYFRFRGSGFERVPPGACLVVANHSVAALPEIVLLLRAWRERFADRPARGLLHRAAWHFPFRLLPVLQKIGGLYAHPEVALRALQRGCALLVFPGGDVEGFRPFSERYRVDFGGRAGFVRLARSARVPIVPVAFCGSHAAYIVLPGARRIASALGLSGLLGVGAFPFTAGSVLLLGTLVTPGLRRLWPLAALLAALPLPTRVDLEVLEPITVDDAESDQAAAARVEAAIQEAVTRMARGRRTPWG